MPKKNGTLTPKERAFCEEYIKTGSSTKAYAAAYGCSFDTANSSAYKKLKNPIIHEYIVQLQKEAFAAACISAERVALKLSDIAFADRDDEVYGASAQLKALDLLQKQLGLQTQKIDAEVSTNINITIEE